MNKTLTIPYLDLGAQYRLLKKEIDECVQNVLHSGQYVLGKEVFAFEKEFADYCGARFGIALNSGTSALHLALIACGVKAGDEVITTPFTFVATVAAIRYIKATPVFVDVDPVSLTMDVSQIESKITSKTKAILPVHIYGQSADMDPILEIARYHNLAVIEDAAQAHGALYKGKRVGGFGDVGCFSFHPAKNLGACGEGGIAVTNNSNYAETISLLRDWGQKPKQHHILPGYNYRMEHIQGAILRVKLKYLEEWNEARRGNAAHYCRLLTDSSLLLPQEMPYARHVYHIYCVRTSYRNELQNSLKSQGIETGIHYPFPVHLQPAYADLGHKIGDFPKAEGACRQILSLPIYVGVVPETVRRVSERILEFLHGEGRKKIGAHGESRSRLERDKTRSQL